MLEFKTVSYDNEKKTLKQTVHIKDACNLIHSIEDSEENLLYSDKHRVDKLTVTLKRDTGLALTVNLKDGKLSWRYSSGGMGGGLLP